MNVENFCHKEVSHNEAFFLPGQLLWLTVLTELVLTSTVCKYHQASHVQSLGLIELIFEISIPTCPCFPFF